MESRRVREPRRTALPQSRVLLVSGWSLANHSNSESFLMVPVHSAKVDASERDSGKWTDTQGHLSTFPKLFPLVVAY